MEDRFTPPFVVGCNGDAYFVQDGVGQKFAFTYYREQPLVGTDGSPRVSRRLAERTAKFMARQATAWAAQTGERHG